MKDFQLIRLLTDYLVHENNMFCRSCKMFSTFIFSHSGLCLYAGLQLNQRPRFLPHCVLPVSLCTYMLLLASDQMHHYSLISDICILVPESVWERETVCNWMKTKVRLNCVDGCFFKSDFCDQMCYEPDVVLLWLCFTPNLQPSVNENVCVCVHEMPPFFRRTINLIWSEVWIWTVACGITGINFCTVAVRGQELLVIILIMD